MHAVMSQIREGIEFPIKPRIKFVMKVLSHYDNTPMQYTANFDDYKKKLELKKLIVCLVFGLIDCGYTLEPPQ